METRGSIPLAQDRVHGRDPMNTEMSLPPQPKALSRLIQGLLTSQKWLVYKKLGSWLQGTLLRVFTMQSLHPTLKGDAKYRCQAGLLDKCFFMKIRTADGRIFLPDPAAGRITTCNHSVQHSVDGLQYNVTQHHYDVTIRRDVIYLHLHSHLLE